jgi:NADH:ubiquinone oxidoreductase subunit 2 (subunit N)
VLSAAWLAEVPWPLRIVRGVLILLLVFGLIAAVVWLGFGRDAEKQVVDLGEGLTAIALIFFVPVLLFGLIAVPFHRWLMKKTFGAAQDHDHFQV